MKKVTIKFISFIALILIVQFSFAIPAIPTPIVYTQPNGDSLTIVPKGDERIHWSESMDGYTLLHNKAGFLSYAVLDDYGNLQPSDFIATDIDRRDASIISFLNSLEKKLFFSEFQRQIMLEVWKIEDEATSQQLSNNEKGITVHYKTVCAFVEFPELPMTKSLEDFRSLFNILGYSGNGASGSIKDYYREVSYGQMDITISLFGPYTAEKSKADYALGSCIPLAHFLAKKVVDDPDFNIKDFSNNGKTIDGFHFIFAGRCQAESHKPTDIWSHKSQFSPAVVKDGISISIYSCSPELRSTSSMATIGVVCHEMCHAILGATDYYDTNYGVGGEFNGTGDWDLMASGSYNSNGTRPAHPNMLIKIQKGWVTPTVLNSEKTITNMPNSAEKPEAYRINTKTSNEYYLLENRQRIGFDRNVPGSGLLIYHVHPNQNSGVSGINDGHPQRMYPVCAGSNNITQKSNATPTDYGAINSNQCPFPYNYKSSFTAETFPAMKSWFTNYANVDKPLTNITNVNELVSFDFMGGTSIDELDELKEMPLIIIPNPANEYVDLQFSVNYARFEKIDFYNAFGQLVKSVPCNGALNDSIIIQRISISDLSEGIYFVSVGNSTSKLVVQ
jgi:M6 family metalloprotease-like protein